MSSFIMYGNTDVDKTLNPAYMTKYYKKAQIEEFRELISLISQLYSETRKPLKILDIGVGDGRITLSLSKNQIWPKVGLFTGIDNSQVEIEKAIIAVKKARIENKVKIINFDALNLGDRNSETPQRQALGLLS